MSLDLNGRRLSRLPAHASNSWAGKVGANKLAPVETLEARLERYGREGIIWASRWPRKA